MKYCYRKAGFSHVLTDVFLLGRVLEGLERALDGMELVGCIIHLRWASGGGWGASGALLLGTIEPPLESSTAVIQTGVFTTSSTESPSAVGTTREQVSASWRASFHDNFALSRMLVRRIEELQDKKHHCENVLFTLLNGLKPIGLVNKISETQLSQERGRCTRPNCMAPCEIMK